MAMLAFLHQLGSQFHLLGRQTRGLLPLLGKQTLQCLYAVSVAALVGTEVGDKGGVASRAKPYTPGPGKMQRVKGEHPVWLRFPCVSIR